jgi:hypothetical protein
MECNSKPRTYDHGEIDNCWDFIDNTLGSQPIVIEDRYLDLFNEDYSFIQLNEDWFLIEKTTAG